MCDIDRQGEINIHISELSRKTGVSLRSLRYYEEKELLNPARRDNGYRDYTESDIERVRIIQLYFSLGLNVNEIMDFFHCAFSEEIKHQCLPNAIHIGEKKLEEIRTQIETLRKAEAHLESCLGSWKEMLRKGGGQNV
ncbi:MerR family transcriptional regulator [Paenibacillus alkalitolerans]|uniref:MerR family transcriptional regulator n=1 Tax=Paenibacillus alkalitolerans TaxID=2799335 RepID=UPI0018F27C82|nr:MerR family transcriptional regulator [Paenibacillus alkalitolerans]